MSLEDHASVRVSIASSLEDIAEETIPPAVPDDESPEGGESYFPPNPIDRAPDLESGVAEETEAARPDSIASTDSSSYETASARSSISDLTTSSTISAFSSAFPDTPQHSQQTSPILPTPGDQFPPPVVQKGRARSQTVVNVTQVDLLRTAVGRTMSLQPAEQLVVALLEMTATAAETDSPLENPPTSDEGVSVPAAEGASETASVLADYMKKEQEALSGLTTTERFEEGPPAYEYPTLSRPENGMHKTLSQASDSALISISQQNPTSQINLTRSNSFPAKLLSRRKSISNPSVPHRRSEVLKGGGVFWTALKAFRGDQTQLALAGTTTESELEIGSPTPTPTPMPDGNDESSAFDAYYLGLMEDLETEGWMPEEEQTKEGPGYEKVEGHVPCIRVTSH